jgi:DNA (cytosine-5)-methyltransferase 1
MRYLSLFSGVGGGDLGCQHLLGWECVGYVEWESYPCKVLEARIKDGMLSDAPIWNVDIREFNTRTAEQYRGVADVVTGGFPCQPFSAAGKGEAADDERNMWPATCDTIRRVRPEWCLLENVSGLASTGYLDTVIGDLHTLRYDTRWDIISASDVGAPHRRDRQWIVAHTNRDRNGERIPTTRQGCNPVGTDDCWRSWWSKNTRPGKDQENVSTEGNRYSTQWETEPLVGRLVDGISNGLDRGKGIGNAQVPLVAAVAWDRLHRDLIHDDR